MKIRAIAIFVLIALICAIPAYADTDGKVGVDTKAIDFVPDIAFNGTEAYCTVQITGDNVTDTIAAKMTLKQGVTAIDSWSGIGHGFLILRGETTVSLGVTYTLIIESIINGVKQPTVTILRTNA